MKKNGFTLAEVLITLAIIGVVATLTLPALMTNTQEQQAKSALKKGINTLTEAAQMNQAIDGFDYSNLKVDDKNEDAQSLYGLLSKRTSMDYRQSGECNSTAGVDAKRVCKNGTTDGSNYVVYFRDGSSLIFASSAASNYAGNENGGAADVLQNDGLVYGIGAVYDTNGSKGPNVLSNCEHNVSGVEKEAKQAEDKTLDEVCTKSERVIKDQFGVRLRGGYAVPNGPAARWAFNN